MLRSSGESTEFVNAGRRRWAVLVIGMVAMTAGCAFQFGLAYLIPALMADGLTLAQAGLLAAAPTVGLLATLIAWGAAADRWGERWVLTIGLATAGVILLAGIAAGGTVALGVCFLLAGAAGAAVHASSGRLILGWFAAHERGLAMGLRQTAQPLGVAVAALVLPSLTRPAALLFLGAFCLVAAALVAIVVRNPEAAPATAGTATGSPYRTPVLWRLHAASALLIVPQFTVATFALVFLVERHAWEPSAAGRVLAAGQIAGALARLGAGWWSDRVRSRTRPMRIVALGIALVMALLAAAATTSVAVAALLVAGVLSVSPNGLAFTAVGEYAGRAWAGRALGVQNTAQNAVAALTPPIMAAVIGTGGYRVAFAAAIVFPLLAAVVIPGAPLSKGTS
ncbi:MFS transporter [Actinoplanes palleronii]|uniref:MFS transporter n=1 Tax=Actinoplanes palleronii TaxID=113570 RepID=UPI001941ECE2|nr:MFS transporter [Actinoplanes palleronii]